MHDAPVQLTIVASEAEAELACGLLREAGIESTHRITDHGVGATGSVPWPGLGSRELLVHPEDLERAREVLAQLVEDNS